MGKTFSKAVLLVIFLLAMACIPWAVVLCLNLGFGLAAVMTDRPVVWNFWPDWTWLATKVWSGFLAVVFGYQFLLGADQERNGRTSTNGNA